MKRSIALTAGLAVALSASLSSAQQPPAPAPTSSASPSATRPARTPVPPATGDMLDIANRIVDAINKQDAAGIQKMVADDAVYLDEDGHAPAPSRWIGFLTTTPAGAPPKKIEISSTHGQTWDNTGWVSFNYTIAETINGEPKSVRGTASLTLRKNAAGEWKIQMIHGALYQRLAGLPPEAK